MIDSGGPAVVRLLYGEATASQYRRRLVMHRGIERRRIFDDARDHEAFLDLLGETSERYRIRMHAYCLLGNHYHAIVQTPDANLSEGMQWLGLTYIRLYNIRNNRVGPLFQGRFISGRCR